jgi:hypothetical protein
MKEIPSCSLVLSSAAGTVAGLKGRSGSHLRTRANSHLRTPINSTGISIDLPGQKQDQREGNTCFPTKHWRVSLLDILFQAKLGGSIAFFLKVNGLLLTK